jgi:hypothetical protein
MLLQGYCHGKSFLGRYQNKMGLGISSAEYDDDDLKCTAILHHDRIERLFHLDSQTYKTVPVSRLHLVNLVRIKVVKLVKISRTGDDNDEIDDSTIYDEMMDAISEFPYVTYILQEGDKRAFENIFADHATTENSYPYSSSSEAVYRSPRVRYSRDQMAARAA